MSNKAKLCLILNNSHEISSKKWRWEGIRTPFFGGHRLMQIR